MTGPVQESWGSLPQTAASSCLLWTLHRFTCSLQVPWVLPPSSQRGKWFSSLSQRSSSCLFTWVGVAVLMDQEGPIQCYLWIQLSEWSGEFNKCTPFAVSWSVSVHSSLGQRLEASWTSPITSVLFPVEILSPRSSSRPLQPLNSLLALFPTPT